MNILNVKELSDILKVKEKTLYQWAELGQIHCIKINGCLRFDLDDIKEWINCCKKEVSSGYNPLTLVNCPRSEGDKCNGALPKR